MNNLKILLLAPMASVFKNFNSVNIIVLKQLGYEVHIASNFGMSFVIQNYVDTLKRDNIIVHDINFRRQSLLRNMIQIIKLRKLLKTEQFDLIHAQTETGGILLKFAQLFLKIKAKVIYTPHGISFYKGSSITKWILFYWLEEWICKSMDLVTTMNQEEYDIIKKWIKEKAIYTHGVGIDLQKIQQVNSNRKRIRESFGVNDDDIMLLSVGELNKNKNHQIVIKAMSMAKNIKLKYVICGVGQNYQRLIKLATKLKIQNQVTLAGYRHDIIDIAKSADIFVFPSHHEGLPMSVMEAMAVGLPIIGSKIRGIVELVDDNKGGYLINSQSANQYCVAINFLIENIELRNKFGKYNLTKIIEFSSDKVKTELEHIYRSFLNEY